MNKTLSARALTRRCQLALSDASVSLLQTLLLLLILVAAQSEVQRLA